MSLFEILLLRLIVSNGLPFTFVENEETIAIFQFIAPGIKLPKRKAISGRVLKKSSEALQENIIKVAKDDQDGVTATFDGWTNVKTEQLLGVVIMTSEGRPYVWKAADISSERETHVEIMEKTEAMITELEEKSINVCAVVTDSAGAYAAAR